ncbi:MAG: hypothetical protein MHM6MM_006291 [Cercozoa sp. M6MM]
MQQNITAAENCRVPVIACVHGGVIGGAIDLITACDIRIASSDAFFSVKEVDIGMAADVGTLQRLPKVVRSDSWVRDVCLTGRRFDAQEALQQGLVSRVCEDKKAAVAAALELASTIAKKSPIAVAGTKHLLNYSRSRTTQEGLLYTQAWNMSMLQSEDLGTAAMASLSRQVPRFAAL